MAAAVWVVSARWAVGASWSARGSRGGQSGDPGRWRRSSSRALVEWRWVAGAAGVVPGHGGCGRARSGPGWAPAFGGGWPWSRLLRRWCRLPTWAEFHGCCVQWRWRPSSDPRRRPQVRLQGLRLGLSTLAAVGDDDGASFPSLESHCLKLLPLHH